MCVSHDTLENHYKVNFTLMQHHKYSLSDLENMVPWERQVYLGLLMQHIKEENERQQAQNQRMMSRRR